MLVAPSPVFETTLSKLKSCYVEAHGRISSTGLAESCLSSSQPRPFSSSPLATAIRDISNQYQSAIHDEHSSLIESAHSLVASDGLGRPVRGSTLRDRTLSLGSERLRIGRCRSRD